VKVVKVLGWMVLTLIFLKKHVWSRSLLLMQSDRHNTIDQSQNPSSSYY